MADSKISALTELTTLASGDLFAIVDDPSGTPVTKKVEVDSLDDYLSASTKTLTNKTLTSPTLQGTVDGWVSANETWEYASATTITVPSGAAAKYQKGDKFKLTANSVVLQGYIVIVADTLLTVVGNTLTNHTFTANYYSKANNPQGFPDWFSYTPTFTGFSSDPTVNARFSLNAETCILSVHTTAGGTSNSTAFTISAPITSANIARYSIGLAQILDNGSLAGGCVRIAGNTTEIEPIKTFTTTTFTASGSKYASFTLIYEI